MPGVLAYRTWWRYLVVDEGHILKNDMSQVSQALRKFHFAHALLLTGAPLARARARVRVRVRVRVRG